MMRRDRKAGRRRTRKLRNSTTACPKSRSLGIESLEQRSLLDGTPLLLGPEFLVNTQTFSSQQKSDVAMDADGNFVVVWEGFDDDDRGIFAQRFDPRGQPLDVEFRVNVSSLDNQVTPAVAMDEDGDFVVVWSSEGSFYYGSQGSGFFIPFSEVRGRRFNEAGVPQDVPGMPGVSEFPVNTVAPINVFPDNLQRNPDVAIDSSGDFVVAWDQNYSYAGNFNVYFRRFNAAGTPQGGRVTVNNEGQFLGQDITPAVAMDEDGDFVVAFDRNAGSGYLPGIFARQFNAAGVPQTAMEFQVDNGTAEVDVVREPAAGMDATGDFVIAWTELAPPNGPAHFDIRARRFNAAGVAQDVPGMPGVSEFLVNTTTARDQTSPAVAMNGAGQFLIVWQSQGVDAELILGQFYEADGAREGVEFQINSTETGPRRMPSVAINDNCNFIVTWDGNGLGDDQGIFAQRLISCSLEVTTTDDGGMGSLRKAIICANLTPGPDTILLPDGIYNLTIAGQFEDLAETGDLDITDDLTIVGFSTDGTIIDAGDLDRVFQIIGDITVNLSGMTLRNGMAGNNGNGGGILNTGSLTLTSVTVGDSQAEKGAGIYHTGGGTLELINSTVALNMATGGKGAGGGILNNSGTVLITDSNILGNTATLQGGGLLNTINTGNSMTIVRSTVAHNSAGDGGGGGIYNRTTMTIINSTISDNETTGNGGGIANVGNNILSLSFVTIADNRSNTDATEGPSGGGVHDTTETGFEAGSTIFADNTSGAGNGSDIFGTLDSQGFNLIENTAGATISGNTTGNILGMDPLLGPLVNNGGGTPTHALLSGSPALNAADPDGPPPTDQRGVTRRQGAGPDIGAFEALIITINDVTVVEGNSGTVNAVFTVTLSSAPNQPVTVVFATADGTATAANNDYEPTTGTLAFMPASFTVIPGETVKTITVLVNGDLAVEPDETFFVNLAAAVNGAILDPQGVGTIVNDDEGGEEEVPPILVTGADAGGGPHVRVFNASTRELLFDFFAYNANFMGGVRVAVGDLNADGVPDIITGAGPGGGPHVRAFDGSNGQPLPGLVGGFFAYNVNFTGGVYVASGDVNNDGADDIITGADAGGGPHVRVFDGRTGLQLPGLIGSFFAYKSVDNAGVRVAAGDVDGDGRADVITGMGPGYADDAERSGFRLINQPEVRVFSGFDGRVLRTFLPFEPGYRGGVHLAVGHFDGDLRAEIIVSKANGDARTDAAFNAVHIDPFRKPQVSLFRYQLAAPPVRLASFDAYSGFGGSVRVGVVEGVFKEFDPSTDADDYFGLGLISGAGPTGGPHVRMRSQDLISVLDEFFAYDPSFLGGIFVAGSMRPPSAPPGGA